MTYIDIIYTNLLRMLRVLTVDDVQFEAYANGLVPEKQDEILAQNDKISALIADLEASRILGEIPTSFDVLIDVTTVLATEHPGLVISQLTELKLIPLLIKKLDEAIAGTIDITAALLDVDEFVFEPLKKPVIENNFYHGDADINESLMMVNLNNISELIGWVETTQISRDMTAHLLAKIGGAVPLDLKQYVLVHKSLTNKAGAIQSLVSLHMVINGKMIHEPETYNQPFALPANRKILKANAYQQFNDAISILSDYNNDVDILDKFLRLYHLIENFMYRFPLVSLEAKHGNLFYIRDFQIMYEKVSDSEAISLRKLVKEVFPKNYDETTTFDAYIFGLWNDLATHTTEPKMDMLLTVLGFEGTYGKISLERNQFAIPFAKMIYAIRNSLVHNKDTELHLTHETLSNHARMGDTAAIFLRKFLMPALSAISLYLIVEKNSIVWLENSTLQLWSDS
ncbi:hypothetical protein SAMN06265348_1284 [Pedobacter westerhofensis]|uniref:Uncharacterized protein n=2 Tax=Pedobacter westerhofensis TaxID=425512 RepID=A0A521FUR7_9SPHI|nr:hypothetical protein SAMN06265348_1284 [Pedobacter westerhofensis]